MPVPSVSPPRKIQVLIVDDSLLFRKTLENRLSQDPRIEIIGTAVDSFDAMEKIRSLHPDVVTLDVEMPRMNGIDFLKKLIPIHPVPVIVVSSLPINVLDALEAGAVDFVEKPKVQSGADLARFVGELSGKISIAASAHVRKRAAAPAAAAAPRRPSVPSLLSAAARNDNTVIAIGASTGGTDAILEVVRNLPATTPGVVIVQHMPPVFTRMYSERLDKICHMRVKEAADMDRVKRGQILIAPGGFQMKLCKDTQGYFVRVEEGAKVNGHCPSVEVLFNTAATVAGTFATGVILTGMGADGAKGLLNMRKAGAYTIGQDKDSCVVYGMPQAAFTMGAVMKQLPLDKICGEIISHLNMARPQ